MSGRVGDLSPKQAETLAKVRHPPYPVGYQGKWLRDGVERMARTLPPPVDSACPLHCHSAVTPKEGYILHS